MIARKIKSATEKEALDVAKDVERFMAWVEKVFR
jgi:hypothetical protein